MTIIDHLTLTVRDASRSKDFYSRALKPLGYAPVMEWEGSTGFGPTGKPSLWIRGGETPTQPMHLAFVAPDRAAVDAFHAAAVAAGAADNGAPGLRPDYHPNYYAAFVFDPDGHPIEAVCHRSGEALAVRARAAPARGAARKAAKRKAPRRARKAGRKAAKRPKRR